MDALVLRFWSNRFLWMVTSKETPAHAAQEIKQFLIAEKITHRDIDDKPRPSCNESLIKHPPKRIERNEGHDPRLHGLHHEPPKNTRDRHQKEWPHHRGFPERAKPLPQRNPQERQVHRRRDRKSDAEPCHPKIPREEESADDPKDDRDNPGNDWRPGVVKCKEGTCEDMNQGLSGEAQNKKGERVR